VVKFADASAREIFLVGGYLRDVLIAGPNAFKNKAIKDFDFALTGTSAFNLAKEYASAHGGHFVPLDLETDTARVVMPDGTILDFAACVGDSITTDVKRRDCSINALYWDHRSKAKIQDLVGGLDDIRKGRIRALSEQVLIDDPLRMLRAFRFASLLSFTVTTETREWIERRHDLIETVAPERINAELFAIFGVKRSTETLKALSETGLLEKIFPELAPTRGVPKNPYHHLGLYDHSVETVAEAERAIFVGSIIEAPHLSDELSYGVSRLSATKLACLLHDIGKPKTWVVTPEGKHTFIGHDALGAEMIEVLSDRMHWSKPVERFISKLVRWHLRPGQLFHQKDSVPSEKAFYRFYRKIGSEVPELLLLALGDLGATQGPSMAGENSEKLRQNLIELFRGYNVFHSESADKQRLMTGVDVMKLLGIQAGPEVGQILAALDEAQGFKEVTDRAQAEDFVLKFVSKSKE
jgi:putative nucleotidyltransferase with HDIG domain